MASEPVIEEVRAWLMRCPRHGTQLPAYLTRGAAQAALREHIRDYHEEAGG